MSSTRSDQDLYALVDCNNFYASCERVFDPAARQAPVIVLSNNDGCVIARSPEAKALGIRMGQPAFECRDLIRRQGVRVFSSNYALYGDLSARIMNVLSGFSPQVEIYSIDEAFLLLKGFRHFCLAEYAGAIRAAVRQQTGVPVSVGIGRTKTLAKVANQLAKQAAADGVFCLCGNEDDYLRDFPVAKIWGIGRRRADWLAAQGVTSAYGLKNIPDALARGKMTVTGLRTVWELRGIPCLTLEELAPDKKAIACSRMFGQAVERRADLAEAVAVYIGRACVKLRRQGSLAGYLQVAVETSRFRADYYHNALGIAVDPPTAYTPRLIQCGRILLDRLFRPGCRYTRAGVLLTGLVKGAGGQRSFLGEEYPGTPRQRLMQVIDRYNASARGGRIQLAAEGLSQPWAMRQARRSRRFTTRWDELLEVRI